MLVTLFSHTFIGDLLDHLGILPKFSAIVPSGCCLFPWMMLATDSLITLCYSLHRLQQFYSFQLGSKCFGLACMNHVDPALQNMDLLHGRCNYYPTKDIPGTCAVL